MVLERFEKETRPFYFYPDDIIRDPKTKEVSLGFVIEDEPLIGGVSVFSFLPVLPEDRRLYFGKEVTKLSRVYSAWEQARRRWKDRENDDWLVTYRPDILEDRRAYREYKEFMGPIGPQVNGFFLWKNREKDPEAWDTWYAKVAGYTR